MRRQGNQGGHVGSLAQFLYVIKDIITYRNGVRGVLFGTTNPFQTKPDICLKREARYEEKVFGQKRPYQIVYSMIVPISTIIEDIIISNDITA